MSFPLLNHTQQKAVYSKGHTLITACPGSGKTRVLAARAAYILENYQGKVCAVTFTKDAAKEIKKRIIEYSGAPSNRIVVGTFHSLALKQLKNENIHPKILSNKEYLLILEKTKQSIKEAKDLTLDDVIKMIEHKSTSLRPNDTDIFNLSNVLYMQYIKLKNILGVMDFFDLLHFSINGMKDGTVKPLNIKWLLVDEAQDMDQLQYEWIKCHINLHKVKVTMVGDDDQTIYSWRNALGYEGLLQFKNDYQALHINLDTNYRSVPSIIYPAAKLISYNKNRIKKNIQAYRKDNGFEIKVKVCIDRLDEAQEVMKTILENNSSFNDWAILSRTNALLDLIEIVLKANDVPCHRYGERSFWDTTEGAVFLRLLKSVMDNDIKSSLLALQWAGVPQDVIMYLEQIYPTNLINGLILACDKFDQTNKVKKIIVNFFKFWKQWCDAIHNGREKLAIIGISRWCQSNAHNNSIEKFKWCEFLFLKTKHNLKQKIALLTKSKLKYKENNHISLMTIHSSKGLEFNNVCIIGVEESIIPHKDSFLEEERRLFYVGMTRAKNKLFFFHTIKENNPSRFLQEI